MDFNFSIDQLDNLTLIQKLLQPNDSDANSDSSDDDLTINPQQKLGPADIVPSKKKSKNVYNLKKQSEDIVQVKCEEQGKLLPINEDKDPLENWLEQQEKEDADILDSRKRPEYTIAYKQAVGTEDVFLRINNRTPGSMSCEDMIIKIQMPEETVTVEEMDLTVTENKIDLKSPIYRLKLPLMQPIDPDKGTAKFDSDHKVLTLILRMRRELDFVNF